MSKEQDIENRLIAQLQDLKYTYRDDIRTNEALESNFRQKFEDLNYVRLTDSEFARLKDAIINPDVFQAATILRERNTFQRDDGTPLQYTLVNIKDWCKNDFEVVNQLRINHDTSYHRYDVILLINGLPVVQIELKNVDIVPRRAINQIVDYKNDLGNGYATTLMCFMQLFIVSNETNTYYFANNQNKHFSFDADERFLPVYQWAKEDNTKVTHLTSFSEQFLEKCTLGQMISRYMVLVSTKQQLMMMRPYQIYAVKAVVNCIKENRGNGFIWHTTGSGKTLTSFKTSTLLKDDPNVDKCLFVVDRKDLDRQTREEFNKFQEGCVEENTNTEALVRRLLSDDYADKVIVTTIQKLGLALDASGRYKERLEPLKNKRIAFIFDECHRSQFGENHQAIKTFFNNAQLFGFTGTPIFEENATYRQIDGTISTLKTTEDIFGGKKPLHAYTITHAIDDKNVLRFHIDYFTEKSQTSGKKNGAPAPEAVVEEIIKHHDAATNQRRFNAIFATASINDAIRYYELFQSIQQKKQADDSSYQPLNIACVFSPPAEGDKDVKQLQDDLAQEKADNQQAPNEKKQALKTIVDDYNQQYSMSHTINSFDAYYQCVQERIKNQEFSNSDYPHSKKIDIVIVVDMLLTGFDSKYLNTLYVDKNLKHHGLIQAFSRTNRVLNDTKPHGKILDFRGQESAVNEAIRMFSNERENEAKDIWLVDPAPKIIKKFDAAVRNLERFMSSQNLECNAESVHNLRGDEARGEFINHFKEVQRLKTQLDQYTDLDEEQQAEIEQLLPTHNHRAFKGAYLETTQRLREQQGRQADGESNTDDYIEQLDFELVLFSSAFIDYDYIMSLIADSTNETVTQQEMTRTQLIELISSNADVMDEREDIIAYINSLPLNESLNEQAIKAGYEAFKAEQSSRALNDLAKKHQLVAQTLQEFVDNIMGRMIFDGEQLNDLLAPLELGWKDRTKAELALMEDLVPLLHKLAKGREISGLAAYE